jgi:hypothetical protein
MVTNFLTPERIDAIGLPRRDSFTLFANVEVIFNCHKKFLETLTARVGSWTDNAGIGDLFLAAAWIKLYKYYINNYDTAARALTELRASNTAFATYLKSIEYTPTLLMNNLDSLLVVPVQRIPRYVLLLSDLAKSTPGHHSDHDSLKEAHEKAKELADYMNTSKREAESMVQLEDLGKKIAGLPVKLPTTKRRLVKEGPMMVDKKKGHMWLFSDLFFTSTGEKKGRFKFKYLVNLATAALQPVSEPENSVRLVSTDRVLLITGATEADIIAWKKALDAALELAKETLIKSAFTSEVTDLEGSRQFLEIQATRNAEKRAEIMKKLIAAETEYAAMLEYTMKHFLIPIKKAPESLAPMLSVTIAQTIVSNFDKLQAGHSELAQCLQELGKDWSASSTIADVWVVQAEFLTGYRHYVSHNVG